MKRTIPPIREDMVDDIPRTLNLDGTGRYESQTGIPFFDHTLDAFCRHGLFDLRLEPIASGEQDYEAILGDAGKQMGHAFAEAKTQYLTEPASGHFILPMDDVLVRVSLDLFSDKSVLNYKAKVKHPEVRSFDIQELESFFQAFTENSGFNLHIRLEYGEDPHHAAEAIFKCFARALDAATAIPLKPEPMTFWQRLFRR